MAWTPSFGTMRSLGWTGKRSGVTQLAP
jgi:hypothetical protein